jgi:hypothetical protein
VPAPSELYVRLLNGLVSDEAFRVEFQGDPTTALHERFGAIEGLDELEAEVGHGPKAMETLEIRQSRSNLAGMLMAVASEGAGLVEMFRGSGGGSGQLPDALNGAIEHQGSSGPPIKPADGGGGGIAPSAIEHRPLIRAATPEQAAATAPDGGGLWSSRSAASAASAAHQAELAQQVELAQARQSSHQAGQFPVIKETHRASQRSGAGGAADQADLAPNLSPKLQAAVDEANKIAAAKLPYVYGGGHIDPAPTPAALEAQGSGYDCSSTVSRVLQAAGVHIPTIVSGDFPNYTAPGPGAITIYSNPEHVFMKIDNRYFGTSTADNPGGGAGWIHSSVAKPEAESGRYTVTHVEGIEREAGGRPSGHEPPTAARASDGRGGGSGSELADVSAGYPGDDASQAQFAAWMGAEANKRGIPPELPVMAALVESNLQNLNYGDADSVGFFQMRASIWDQGEYAGYQQDPEKQIDWFLDHAEAVKQQRIDAGLSVKDPSQYGEWVADVEMPASEYRARYQEQLANAQALLKNADLNGGGGPVLVSSHSSGSGALHGDGDHEADGGDGESDGGGGALAAASIEPPPPPAPLDFDAEEGQPTPAQVNVQFLEAVPTEES